MAEPNLAAIFRRLLREHYSLCGSRLEVNAAIAITRAEFDLLWDTLDEIDGADFLVSANDDPSPTTGSAS